MYVVISMCAYREFWILKVLRMRVEISHSFHVSWNYWPATREGDEKAFVKNITLDDGNCDHALTEEAYGNLNRCTTGCGVPKSLLVWHTFTSQFIVCMVQVHNFLSEVKFLLNTKQGKKTLK